MAGSALHSRKDGQAGRSFTTAPAHAPHRASRPLPGTRGPASGLGGSLFTHSPPTPPLNKSPSAFPHRSYPRRGPSAPGR